MIKSKLLASKHSFFCGAFLIPLALLELGNFNPHVVLKLLVHGRSVAQLEKNFEMDEKWGEDKRYATSTQVSTVATCLAQ
jgi:hypothetical protein